jgi:hypothetical protein
MPSDRITIYLDPKLKKDIEKLAEARFLSVSSLLVSLAAAEVREAKKNKEIK